MNRWEKPLPARLGKYYYEYSALITLAELFPKFYINLVLTDKPDLQDTKNSIGVEVTRALEEGEGEIEGLYTKYVYDDNNDKKKTATRLRELGANSYVDNFNFLAYPSYTDNMELIISVFTKKIVKLNSDGHKKFNHNHLFIHSHIYVNTDMLMGTVEKMKVLQNDYVNKYENVFIYVPKQLYVCDLLKSSAEIIKLTTNKQSEWAIKAREKVEEL